MAGTRASLSISTPNEDWIQSQITSGEFSSRSEVVNDLIRRMREAEERAIVDSADDDARWQRYVDGGQTISADAYRKKLQLLAAQATKKQEQ